MKGMRAGIMVLVLLVVGAAVGFAQLTDTQTITFTISNFSEIAVAPSATIAFTVTGTGAGDPGDAPEATGGDNGDGTDDSSYLNYTVLTSTNRTISVGSDVAAPAGTTLTVDVATATGFVGALVGTGPYLLDGGASDTIINGIGSGATGTGANGAQLTYEFLVVTPGSLSVGGPNTMTVTYTITDA